MNYTDFVISARRISKISRGERVEAKKLVSRAALGKRGPGWERGLFYTNPLRNHNGGLIRHRVYRMIIKSQLPRESEICKIVKAPEITFRAAIPRRTKDSAFYLIRRFSRVVGSFFIPLERTCARCRSRARDFFHGVSHDKRTLPPVIVRESDPASPWKPSDVRRFYCEDDDACTTRSSVHMHMHTLVSRAKSPKPRVLLI